MQRIRGIDSLPPDSGPSVVTIGKFLAVHLGHQRLISLTRERGQALGATSVVLTFDRHPHEILRPGGPLPLLTSLDERLDLLEALGVDACVVVQLDEKFLAQTPEEFVERILVRRLRAAEIVASDNFRFGKGAAGTVETLQSLAAGSGFGVTVTPPVMVDGAQVSTSRIAASIASGDVELAARMLGRYYRLTGRVVEGDRRGRTLGFPTANLSVDSFRLLPGDGVYLANAHLPGRKAAAVVNVGVRPTVDGSRRLVEAHLLDFEGDLYGEPLSLDFRKKLRDEVRFENLDALAGQIARDILVAREITGSPAGHEPSG